MSDKKVIFIGPNGRELAQEEAAEMEIRNVRIDEAAQTITLDVISPERIEELDRAWNESDLMDDDDFHEWYGGLTAEEQALIDAWDKQYEQGVQRLCSDILAKEKEQG